jgi:hypothetical protein
MPQDRKRCPYRLNKSIYKTKYTLAIEKQNTLPVITEKENCARTIEDRENLI